MKLSSIEKTAAIAWSPSLSQKPLLALGTIAGAMDASFSSQTELELFELTPRASEESFRKAGGIQVNSRFNTLVWSPHSQSGSSLGILAGGKENGELDFYDPAVLMAGKTVKEPLIRHSLFSGPVKGLDYSPVTPGLFAAGGPDAEVFVFDLKSGAKPFKPAPKSPRLEDISTLSWNELADYILAVGSTNGSTAVYDLRGKREIMKLSYPGGRKQVTGIAWHPSNPTRLVTVNDDDNSPLVLTWDLRNASAPEQSFSGHEKGILSVHWCPKDPDLLLTTSKDSRTLIWDMSVGASIGELSTSRNWTFDARWYPRNPDLVAVASFDGIVSIHSLQGQGLDPVDEQVQDQEQHMKHDPNDPFASISYQRQKSMNDLSSSFTLAKPPKWLRRTVGASFAFGGGIVMFSDRKVSIISSGCEPSLTDRVKSLSMLMKTDSPESYKAFCSKMSQFREEGDAFSDKDRETWKFLEVMFEKSRELMLEFLGFSNEKLVGDQLAKLEEKLIATKLRDDELASSKPSIPRPFSLYTSGTAGQTTEDQDTDNLITRHCIVGDFEKAVDICLATNRLSDALVIAISGGPELLQKTQKEYFRRKSNIKSYIRVLQGVVDSNFEDIVNNVDLGESGEHWKDVMAYVATFATSSELAKQFSNLGSRIAEGCRSPEGKRLSSSTDIAKKESKSHAAALCYIGGGDLEKAVDVWTRREAEEETVLMKQTHSMSRLTTHTTALQSLMEKVMVLHKAIHYVDPYLADNGDLDNSYPLALLYSHLAEYSEILSSLGHLDMAWKSLEMIPQKFQLGSNSGVDPLQTLRDRVFHSLDFQNRVAPPFPFETTEVISFEEIQKAQAEKNAQQQQAQQNQVYNNSSAANGYRQSYGYQGAQQYNNVASYPSQNPYGQNQYPYSQPVNAYAPSPPINTAPYGAVNQPYQQQSVLPPPTKPTIFQPPPINQMPSQPQFWNQGASVPPPPIDKQSPVIAQPLPPVQQQQPWIPPAMPRQSDVFPQPPSNIIPPPGGSMVDNRVKNEPVAPQQQVKPEMPEEYKDIETGFKKHLDSLKNGIDMVTQKRVFDDADRRIHVLFEQLLDRKISADICQALRDIIKGLDGDDFVKAGQLQIDLMTRHFDKTGLWIMGVKRLIDTLDKIKNHSNRNSVSAVSPSPSGPSPSLSSPPMSGPPPPQSRPPPPMSAPMANRPNFPTTVGAPSVPPPSQQQQNLNAGPNRPMMPAMPPQAMNRPPMSSGPPPAFNRPPTNPVMPVPALNRPSMNSGNSAPLPMPRPPLIHGNSSPSLMGGHIPQAQMPRPMHPGEVQQRPPALARPSNYPPPQSGQFAPPYVQQQQQSVGGPMSFQPQRPGPPPGPPGPYPMGR